MTVVSGQALGEIVEYGYARVSSERQDPQMQIDALTRAGVSPVGLSVDRASGNRTDRPGLAKVLAAVVRGDRVTVWRLDRLGRSMPHLLTTVEGLAGRGVDFRSLSESIDTASASGRLMLSMFAAFAQFERDLIAERTAAGLAAVRASGVVLGRPSQVHPDQVPHIHALAGQGKSHRGIARLTGLSRQVVGRVLRDEIPSLAFYQPTTDNRENGDGMTSAATESEDA